MNSKSVSSLNENDLRKIGKFLHAHGLRGELYLYIFSGDYDWFGDIEVIYLPAKRNTGLFVEFSVKSYRSHKGGILVTLQGVDNRNLSDELSGSEVWIPRDFFITDDSDEKIFLVEIEGFNVFAENRIIGKIIGFTNNGAQDLIIVKPEVTIKENYEIPFVPEFIDEIDYDNKLVKMNLPEGLLELHSVSETPANHFEMLANTQSIQKNKPKGSM